MSVDCLVTSTTPTSAPPVEPDHESMEIVLLRCGTWAPGHVHDPCQHSTYRVLCCQHAGCMADVWNCGTPLPRDSWPVYQAARLDEFFGQLRGWRLLLMVVLWLAVAMIGVITDMFQIMYVFACLSLAVAAALILYGVGHLLALM